MSLKAMAWAYEQRTGDPGLKALLLALANFADEDGYCWPSRATLSEMIEVSEKSVTRYSQRLLDLGLVSMEQRTLENGARSTNGFRLPLEARQLTLTPHPPGQFVPSPGTERVPAPGTKPCPYPRDNCVPTIEPSFELSVERPKAKPKARGAFVVPEWIPIEAWESFKAMRKSIRAPLTDDAAALTVRELMKLRSEGHDPVSVLEQSVMRSWRGVFPLKIADSGRGRAQSVIEQNNAVREEFRRRAAQEETP